MAGPDVTRETGGGNPYEFDEPPGESLFRFSVPMLLTGLIDHARFTSS